MRKGTAAAGMDALSCLAAIGIAACGSSGTATKEGGTATVLMGTAPDYLDRQEGYTTQAAEPDWITYTPLLTYKHASGQEGTKLIPGLAENLPEVSKDGKTYFFLNTRMAPFNNPLAREAVNYAIDRRAFVRLASGFLKPECYFLPDGIAGHPPGSCPYGSKDGRRTWPRHSSW
jgi:ABC-type oligopeptide transport system substrate-binding subunit